VEKKYEIIDKILAVEVYLYIAFTFITKGEAIRNILLFSAFALWLATLGYRKNRFILKQPVSLLFWGNIASIVLAVIFSIDPVYSFYSLRLDPLRSVIIFCLYSTVLSDRKRLETFIYIALVMLVFILSQGYYSYWAYDLPLMRPLTTLRHSWHARYAVDINTLLPFSLIVFSLRNDIRWRVILSVTAILGVSGIILSTSRGGLAGLISMLIIGLVYFLKTGRLNYRLALAGLLLFIIAFSVSFNMSSKLQNKLRNKKDLLSFGRRTEIWAPLLSAAMQRPIVGWGYGEKLFKIDRPFQNTPYKKAPMHKDPAFRNPHNPFLRIFFHQGIIGVILYIALLIVTTLTFWKATNTADLDEFTRYILLSCTGIIVGTFFINAIVENCQLRDLAFVLGIGLAAKNLDKKYDK